MRELPELFKKLLGEDTPKATDPVAIARARREAEIDAAAEKEGMMLRIGPRRIRQRKW